MNNIAEIPPIKEKLLADCSFLVGKLTDEAINYIVISAKESIKLHVEAALKAASEKSILKGWRYNTKTKELTDITCDIGGNSYWEGHAEDQPYADLTIEICANSILNSYPDELIK